VAALLDARGCLTEAGHAALASARPGQAPPELAAHLASCSRCQLRLLAGGPVALAMRKRKPPPPRWRLLAVLVAAVLLVLTAYVTLSRFAP
jgi:hypothetical protein